MLSSKVDYGPPERARIFADACSAIDMTAPIGFRITSDGIIEASTMN